jgi:transglutaminase-like putative cysteine protease
MFMMHLYLVNFRLEARMGTPNLSPRFKAAILAGLWMVAALASLSPPVSAQVPAAPVSAAVTPSWSDYDFSYIVRVPMPSGTHNVRVWIPVPSTDQFQTVSQLQFSAPVKVRVHRDGKYGDRLAYFDLDPSSVEAPLEIRVTFHVLRYERRSDLTLITNPGGILPDEVSAFLQPDEFAPADGVVANLSREKTRGLSDPLQKARSIYEYLVSNCDLSHGDCSDFPSLFVGMARAAGIPARIEAGFTLPEEQKQGVIASYQSWAEFYVQGIGWIPVDVSRSVQEPLKHDYFFGAIDAHRVMVSTGRAIATAPAPKAGPFHSVAYPYIEMDGKSCVDYTMDFFFHESGFANLTPSKKTIFAQLRIRGGEPRFSS